MFIAYNSNLYVDVDEVITNAASGDTLDDYSVAVYASLDDAKAGLVDLMSDYADVSGEPITTLVYEVVEVTKSAKVYTAQAEIDIMVE